MKLLKKLLLSTGLIVAAFLGLNAVNSNQAQAASLSTWRKTPGVHIYSKKYRDSNNAIFVYYRPLNIYNYKGHASYSIDAKNFNDIIAQLEIKYGYKYINGQRYYLIGYDISEPNSPKSDDIWAKASEIKRATTPYKGTAVYTLNKPVSVTTTDDILDIDNTDSFGYGLYNTCDRHTIKAGTKILYLGQTAQEDGKTYYLVQWPGCGYLYFDKWGWMPKSAWANATKGGTYHDYQNLFHLTNKLIKQHKAAW